jgi:tRNA(Ser,Leu) C12 N-acetylase TAN1
MGKRRGWAAGGRAAGGKRPRREAVDPIKGIRALLFTSDPNRGRECEREMLNWLDDLCERLRGGSEGGGEAKAAEPEAPGGEANASSGDAAATEKGEQEDESPEPAPVSAALAAELRSLQAERPGGRKRIAREEEEDEEDGQEEAELQQEEEEEQEEQDGEGSENGGAGHARRAAQRSAFVVVPLESVKNLVLVSVGAHAPDPVILARGLVDDVRRGRCNARYTVRVWPMVTTCFADADAIARMAEPVITAAFAALPPTRTYAIFFERKGENRRVPRDQVMRALFRLVPRTFRVDLKAPQVAVLVTVVMRVAGVAVVDGFDQLAGLNLRALADATRKQQGAVAAALQADARDPAPEPPSEPAAPVPPTPAPPSEPAAPVPPTPAPTGDAPAASAQ